MNAPFQQSWTQEEFFSWAHTQEGRYEFDGLQPIDINDSTIAHAIVNANLNYALTARLRASRYQVLGYCAGLATVGQSIRYPDALVTGAKLDMNARTVDDAIVVFEVLSSITEYADRVVKLPEYAAIVSIRRYVILESCSLGLMVHERASGSGDWSTTALSTGDTLRMPEIGIDVPVADFYEGIGFEPIERDH